MGKNIKNKTLSSYDRNVYQVQQYLKKWSIRVGFVKTILSLIVFKCEPFS